MIDDKNRTFIKESDVSDLIQWIGNHQDLVYRYRDELMNRMRSLRYSSTNTSNNSINFDEVDSLMKVLFTDKKKIEAIDFELLNQATKAIFIDSEEKITEEYTKNIILYSIFIPKDNIESGEYNINMLHLDDIYSYIMDIYIPSADPDVIVNTFINVTNLRDVMIHHYDVDWFEQVFDEANIQNFYYYKELVLLFEYVSDIFTNKESKLEFFMHLHALYRTSYAFSDKFNEIADRYAPYFSTDTRYMMADLIELLQGNDLSEGTYEFLMNWSKKYCKKANRELMKCFIRDISSLIDDEGDSDTNDKVCSMIEDSWGDSEYEYEEISSQMDELGPDDAPITYLASIVTEAVHKDSPAMNNAEKKIYKAYRSYKDAEEKVDSQITKALNGMKNVATGNVREEIIEGKKFTAIGLLKQLLSTVALFSFGKVKGVIALVVKYALKKRTKVSERRKILMELDTEIEMITEKIEDARSDGNREAKYAMMRTKKELENARKRIEYGIEADSGSLSKAKTVLNGAKSLHS